MDKAEKVVLMCGKKDCCPTVSLSKNQVVIEDDFGGRVKLTQKQFALFKKKIKKEDL